MQFPADRTSPRGIHPLTGATLGSCSVCRKSYQIAAVWSAVFLEYDSYAKSEQIAVSGCLIRCVDSVKKSAVARCLYAEEAEEIHTYSVTPEDIESSVFSISKVLLLIDVVHADADTV